jgi:hypothetical protein
MMSIKATLSRQEAEQQDHEQDSEKSQLPIDMHEDTEKLQVVE